MIERLRLALADPFEPLIEGDADFAFGDHQGAPVPAAVLVPIIRHPEPCLLLTTRNASLHKHAGQVAFPGGRVDPTDQSHAHAALREAQEEIGLDPADVDILGQSTPYRTGTGYAVSPIVGALPVGLSYRPNPDEVADLFEVPLGFVLDPRNHQPREAMWQGRLRRYWSIEWQDRTIWGATAGMIVNLSRRLG